MNKKENYIQLSTTIPPKLNKLIRLHAFKNETSLSDMLELYQNAYNEKLEREKNEKIKSACKNCGKTNYPSNM
jgi:hypothetical protein